MLATTLATLALVPQLTLPVVGHAKDGISHDPYTAAFHSSAVCNCAEPLLSYTRYGPVNAFLPDPATGAPRHNPLFVNLLRFIKAKWEPGLPLEGYDSVLVDLERLEQWNLFVETVRADHGLQPGTTPVWPNLTPRTPDDPLIPPAPAGDGIDLPECRDCADDMCDGRRILTYAQESIFGNAYNHSSLEEYNDHFFLGVTRIVPENFWVDIPVGHPRAAPACNVDCNAVAQVHVQMIAGDSISVDVPFIETDGPLLVFVTAYRMCLLKGDGSWLCEQYPLSTPELNHRQVPLGQCHPLATVSSPAPSPGSGTRPGSGGPCGHGFRPIP